MIAAGIGLFMWTIWPIISFTVIEQYAVIRGSSVFGRVDSGTISPIVFAADAGEDLTKADAWLPTHPQKKSTGPIRTYTLTIPKIKITQALVTVAGDDLGKSLIHYGGTALPGEFGTTVIFGHSTLPQFFNQENYKTIFSTLPTVKVGDDVIIKSDGITYTYVVEEILVVDAANLGVLEQQFDDSHLTLVTCVPPGTYWKRLNVRARLKKDL
jgi:sortase A